MEPPEDKRQEGGAMEPPRGQTACRGGGRIGFFLVGRWANPKSWSPFSALAGARAQVKKNAPCGQLSAPEGPTPRAKYDD